MYKIYINNCPLVITTEKYSSDCKRELAIDFEVQCMQFQTKLVSNYVDKLEKQTIPFALILYTKSAKDAYKYFKSYFKVIKAAGGLVINDQNEVLMIYRNNLWDLPKGKMEKNERPKKAAIREVKEETGLKKIRLLNKIAKTRHVYRLNGDNKRVLKITHWYLMSSKDNHLVPQEEEGITKVKWVKKNIILVSNRPFFNNLIDIIKSYTE